MLALLIGFVIVVADQLTKSLVIREFICRESRSVIPGFFNLTYLRNTGAVWGIFQYQNEWLVLLSLLVLALMAVFYRRLTDDRRLCRVALGLMLGGIVGNLIDRIKLGWVTDFLDFHWAGWHWPSFNIADAAICVGVILYIVSSLCSSVSTASKSSSIAETDPRKAHAGKSTAV